MRERIRYIILCKITFTCLYNKIWKIKDGGNRKVLLFTDLNPQDGIFLNKSCNTLFNVLYYDYYYYHKKSVILQPNNIYGGHRIFLSATSKYF